MDPRSVHAFVVKVWLEGREIAGATPEWRGRVDHVQSGRRIYFRDLGELLGFVQQFLAGPASAPPGEEAHDAGHEP